MIEIMNVDCTKMICEADVVLVKPLFFSKRKYNLNLEVKDTRGETTVVETEIQVRKLYNVFWHKYLELATFTGDTTLWSFHRVSWPLNFVPCCGFGVRRLYSIRPS